MTFRKRTIGSRISWCHSSYGGYDKHIKDTARIIQIRERRKRPPRPDFAQTSKTFTATLLALWDEDQPISATEIARRIGWKASGAGALNNFLKRHQEYFKHHRLGWTVAWTEVPDDVFRQVQAQKEKV